MGVTDNTTTQKHNVTQQQTNLDPPNTTRYSTSMTSPRRVPAASPARLKRAQHARLWRAVEGAVVDAFKNHPNYLTAKGRHSAVESVTKRVVGAVIHQASTGGCVCTSCVGLRVELTAADRSGSFAALEDAEEGVPPSAPSPTQNTE